MAVTAKRGARKAPTLEELAIRAREGDDEALRKVYSESLVMLKSMANIYFMVGADRDDVVQEGMIGLLGAIRSFDPDAGVTFKTFSELCVKRRIINAVKMAGRKRHKPLNESISIDAALFEQDENEGKDVSASALDTLRAPQAMDPEEIVMLSELLSFIASNAEALFSDMERAVWEAYSNGSSAAQIAVKLDKSPKSIDNTLTRIKGKIEKLVSM